MNFAELENAWRSPRNQPTATELEKTKMNFVTELNRRHRGTVLFLSAVGGVLTLITARFAYAFLDASGRSVLDFGREWAVLPLLALPWVGWGLLVRQYRRHRVLHPDYTRTVQASVQAALDENRLEQRRYRVVTALQIAALFVLPLVVLQLRAVGKAGDEILVPAFVVFPAILGTIMIASWRRYRRTLQPRERELAELLKSYE